MFIRIFSVRVTHGVLLFKRKLITHSGEFAFARERPDRVGHHENHTFIRQNENKVEQMRKNKEKWLKKLQGVSLFELCQPQIQINQLKVNKNDK